MQPELINPTAANGALAGFRLKRLEMLNWGTFHGKVARLTPEGKWTLLVGVNGTGKSTAADALRTLLVPPRLLNYNDASGERKKGKDRTRKSYVLGAYGAHSEEESPTAITQYLRKSGDQSIILAVFTNPLQKADVTLAQILWENDGAIDQVYLVARSDKNIKDHLTHLGNARDMKKELKRRGFEYDDSFPGYEEKFRRYVGIPSSGALEVFNQAIGVKEIPDLNLFVQRHMLEPSDVLAFIENQIKPHYSELNSCRQSIDKAEAQLKMLTPLEENYAKLVEAETAKRQLEIVQEALDAYYEERELQLRIAYDEDLERALADLQQERGQLKAQQDADLARRESINIELANNDVGRRLREIEFETRDAQRALNEKEERAKALKQNLGLLQYATHLESEDQFKAMRHKLASERGALQGNLETQERKRLEHAIGKETAGQEKSRLAQEAENIRKRGVLIPLALVELRERISEITEVSTDEIPFAGELIEVKDQYREWTGAIERLLHNFGISLLVPENRYKLVAQYINQTHLGLRLVFQRVPALPAQMRQDFLQDSRRVPARLDFREEHPLAQWVKGEVSRRFAHTCCGDIQSLQAVDFGLTKEGMIKDGARHVKDDRSRVGDRSQYVLGWSTASKLAALEEEFKTAQQRFTDHERKCQQAAEQVRNYTAKLGAVDAALKVENYQDINFLPEQQTLQRLNAEEGKLRKSSNKVQELERQLNETKKRIADRETEIKAVDAKAGVKENALKENRTQVKRLKESRRDQPAVPEEIGRQIAELQESQRLTLEDIHEVPKAVGRRVQGRIGSHTGNINEATKAMLPVMQAFLSAYPEATSELKAHMDWAKEFVALKVRIAKEDLPRYKTRFAAFLNTNLIMDMANFNAKMAEHEKAIRERIETVNGSLKSIEFNPGTYVQIVPVNTRNPEIREFRAALKTCLSGGILPSKDDQDRIFNQISDLIVKLEKEKEWAQRVTDARNWLEYGVREIAAKDGKEVNYYAGSTGKSGGQKSKLAFTILASAIAAQYRLGNGEDDNRFRLVVVDEAFGKTDEENSQRALDLFKDLGLQLIVINPFDAKSRIVDDYVDSYHLIHVSDNLSQLRRASRAEYEQDRNQVA
ncbi:MAG TPA: SbcC/MukB-like Walker B domain-containing protein [Verrucomicrobiota bacterium]|jgi:uncharacterized protein YPO0396|nr:SbcC/MukB-like Walker B domain-containing protein [Verrucomicrobiota bacterium]